MKKVTCKKCGYSWNTESKLNILICSNCNSKVYLKRTKKNKKWKGVWIMEEETEENKKSPDYIGNLHIAGWCKVNPAGVKVITLKISQYCDLYKTAVKE